MEKNKIFKKELSYIKDENIKHTGKTLIDLLPDYFFNVPARSTGKYHPQFSLGERGLVRHTKTAVRIAEELLNLEMYNKYFLPHVKDLIILSLILHDGLKHGYTMSQYTQSEHPLYMANFIEENVDKLTIPRSYINILKECISTHMGQWNTNYNGDEIMEKPTTNYQKFVHMCDYLSSKKFLDVKFSENDEIVY